MNQPPAEFREATDESLAAALVDLDRLYQELGNELGSANVRCELRGICCDFERSGHVLFATELEVIYALGRSEPTAAAVDRDHCPWFVGGICNLREGRPLSCRSYFCDPEFADEMRDLTERYHQKIVKIHERHGLPYRYSRFTRSVRRDSES